MPRADEDNSSRQEIKSKPLRQRTRADVAAEIARVDAAIEGIKAHLHLEGAAIRGWTCLGPTARAVALRSLAKYRQRLARS